MKNINIHAALAVISVSTFLIFSTPVIASDRYSHDSTIEEEFSRDVENICEVMQPHINKNDNFLRLQLLVGEGQILWGDYPPIENSKTSISWDISEIKYSGYTGIARLMPTGEILFSISAFWEGQTFMCSESENWGVVY